MNYPIKTNQLIVEYDYSKINDEYDIYKITNDKFFTRNAHIFDSPLIEKGVLSVCYTYGKSFYILLKKRIENKDVIRSIIDNSKYANELTFERVDSQNVYKNVLLQFYLDLTILLDIFMYLILVLLKEVRLMVRMLFDKYLA